MLYIVGLAVVGAGLGWLLERSNASAAEHATEVAKGLAADRERQRRQKEYEDEQAKIKAEAAANNNVD